MQTVLEWFRITCNRRFKLITTNDGQYEGDSLGKISCVASVIVPEDIANPEDIEYQDKHNSIM